MKKIIIVLFLVSLGFILQNNSDEVIIPGEAIRFRVIANSNTIEDQREKLIVKKRVQEEIYKLINNALSVDEVRDIISNNMDTIHEVMDSFDVPYQISYGNNYFPSKTYKNVIYPAGNYESLVITLGSGGGNNFWCVLFPPLCLIENSDEDISDVEYELYVKKLLDKF